MKKTNVAEFRAALDAEIGMESVITKTGGSQTELTYHSPTGWPVLVVSVYEDCGRLYPSVVSYHKLQNRVRSIADGVPAIAT